MMPMLRQSGSGLRFPLFGFPTRIHPSFFLIAVLLGLTSPDLSLSRVALWTVVVLVSVLVHELGHAFAARGLGAKPTIELYVFGGVTAFIPPKGMGRLQSIWVTLAGPLAGFALGGFALSVAAAFGVDRPSLTVYTDSSFAEHAVSIIIFVNIIWGFVNLLPVMPLDGGNIVRNLLPGTPDQRARNCAIGSILLCAGLSIWLVQAGHARLLTLPILLAALNVQAVLADRKAPTEASTNDVLVHLRSLEAAQPHALAALAQSMRGLNAPSQERAKVTAVEVLVQQRRGPEARWALTELPGTTHPSAYALVETIDGAPDQGIAMLDDLFGRQPSPTLARYVLMARVLGGRSWEVPALSRMLPAGTEMPGLLRELQHVAHVNGDYEGSVGIGQEILDRGEPPDPMVMYNLACSSAAANHIDEALAWLSASVDAGWTDVHQLDTDRDFSSLWVTPEFRAIRQRLIGETTAPK